MLIRPDFIEALAETLEGLPLVEATDAARNEATLLIFHSQNERNQPVLELSIRDTDATSSVSVQSALGMIEMSGVYEARLLDSTEEAAFFSKSAPGMISMLTVSSKGVVQLYANVNEELMHADLTDISDDDLRAAVAMKVFAENARVFGGE